MSYERKNFKQNDIFNNKNMALLDVYADCIKTTGLIFKSNGSKLCYDHLFSIAYHIMNICLTKFRYNTHLRLGVKALNMNSHHSENIDVFPLNQ